jgi:hydrogenase maturation protease
MVLVIGYGNPLRRDDGVGPWLVEYVSGLIPDPSIDWRTCLQLTPELAEPLSRAACAIFVDATAEGYPGQVACSRLEVLDDLPPGGVIHHLTPPGVLIVARVLYGACPDAYMLTVAGENFGYGQGFSPSVQAQLPLAIEYLSAAISTQALLHFSPE